MRHADVVFTPAAESDLDDIWFEIASENLLAADRLIDRIRDRAGLLAVFPEAGRIRPEIVGDARSLVEGNYIILYTIKPKQVEIVRVIHAARDLTTLM